MILANRRITVREVAEDLNISIGSCHSIFINDLGMRRVAAKFVPKLLNCDQKQHRMNIANEMLDSVRDDPNLLQRVITGDEAWVYGYDVETKAQSSQWKLPHEPRPKKARQVQSNVKVLLTVFFDCRGVVHHEFLPQGRTVNKEYYLQVMCNLSEAIRQKHPDLWKNKNWLLHHDNAPAHTLLLVRDFLAKNNTLMMPQPPYSPDLAPCDFFLFPKLKRPINGRCYATLDEIKTASKEELKKILKNDFLKCFEDWKNHWHKYKQGRRLTVDHSHCQFIFMQRLQAAPMSTLLSSILIEAKLVISKLVILAKVQLHQRVQVTKQGSGTFNQVNAKTPVLTNSDKKTNNLCTWLWPLSIQRQFCDISKGEDRKVREATVTWAGLGSEETEWTKDPSKGCVESESNFPHFFTRCSFGRCPKDQLFWLLRYSLRHADEGQQPEMHRWLTFLDLSRKGLISTLQLVERLDRYPLRNKRKIDSVEPEETSMNVKKEGTQVSNYVVQHLPRNPSIFSGEDGEDLQKWLKGYARVARYNHWDETLCLTKVYFYLSGTALKWFENNEESIQTWKEFTSQLENQVEKKLKTRAQLKGESTECYIQDVLCLCKEVDPQMSEEDKISHLMKGIAEELYQALLPRDVQSTEQFITECRRVEALRCRRVTPTKYERLPNVASLCDQDDGEDLSSLIRKIVREEIKQALDSPQEEPKIAVIEDLVREEIVKTLAPRSKPTISPPQASRPRYEAQTIRPHSEPHYRKQGRRRDTNDWRTTEGRPICFYCGRPGHVVRYCRDRKRHNEERRNDYFQRKQDAMVSYNSRAESQDPNDESSRKTFTRYRSPTSYRGRNRQHFSLARRSSWTPRH
ncbi:hypothetical protein LAZ67_9003006 [Cordylochernes scorpioides]|uniref:CCHC-type domain-containing protein n=1 Tax=Cordylochernes scorpioides TaxID=51811 RepID=A0ABY6KUV4_9ARAC|nr:hypothetical protein LAZ67_9003006 [Cordylochernes scorpioides]